MLVTTWVIAVLAGVLALWTLWFSLVDRPLVMRQLLLAAAIEVGLLVQLVVAGVGLLRGSDLGDVLMLVGYVVVAMVLLPGAAAWAVVERTRWSSAVLLVSAATIIVMQVRVWHVWSS